MPSSQRDVSRKEEGRGTDHHEEEAFNCGGDDEDRQQRNHKSE